MQIEQYQRRETPTGSAGNVIARQPNSYAELGNLGQTMTDVGFAMEEQRLKAEYHDQVNTAQLQADKDFLEFQESLDPNDTASWDKNLEIEQQTSRGKIKFTNGKAENDFGASWEQDKLRQKASIAGFRRETDARNFTARFPINYQQSMEIAAKQPTPGEYDQSRLSTLRRLFQVELADPEKPIGPDNLQVIEGADNPMFLSNEVKIAKAGAWLGDADKAYEQYQKDALSERIVGEALAMEEEQAISYIDAANEIASREYGLKEGFFDYKEIAALQQQRKANLTLHQATTKKEYDAAVTAGVNAIQEKLYQKRDFTNIRKFIDENLPAAAVDEREHWYDKAEALAKAELSKEDSPFEKTMNPAKKQELLEKAVRDDIRLDEVEKWVGKKDGISISDGQEIRRVLEDDAHIFKTSQVKAWFMKLGNDFGKAKDDPVRAADYSEKLRRYFLDYERANKKLPSGKEVEEFYDKNFVEPGIMKKLTEWATNRIKGFRSPIDRALTADIQRRITDWAAGQDEKESRTQETGDRTLPAGRQGQETGFELEDPGRPASLAEFKQAVASIPDEVKAKAYYERWKNLWQ